MGPDCTGDECQRPADTFIEVNFPVLGTSAENWIDVSVVDGYNLPVLLAPDVNTGYDCGPMLFNGSLMIVQRMKWMVLGIYMFEIRKRAI